MFGLCLSFRYVFGTAPVVSTTTTVLTVTTTVLSVDSTSLSAFGGARGDASIRGATLSAGFGVHNYSIGCFASVVDS